MRGLIPVGCLAPPPPRRSVGERSIQRCCREQLCAISTTRSRYRSSPATRTPGTPPGPPNASTRSETKCWLASRASTRPRCSLGISVPRKLRREVGPPRLHHEVDVLECAHVFQRVPLDCDQICHRP